MENIKKAIIELAKNLNETILEETEWRVLTDMASYNIDTAQDSIFLMRVDKNKEEYPLLNIYDNNIFAWDEKGWHIISELQSPEVLIPILIESNSQYKLNKDKPLCINIQVPFIQIPKVTRKQTYPLSSALNSKAEGMLDNELVPNPQVELCEEMTTLDKEYFFKLYYDNWKISEQHCFEAKWGQVLEGLNNENFYILKEPIYDTLTIVKKGFQKRYILTKNLPFTLISDKENVCKISKFVEEKDLQKECGKHFNPKDIGRNKEIQFKSNYNDKYFRMSKGMLFSAGSMAYTIWKYEGILTEDQTNLYKLVERK